MLLSTKKSTILIIIIMKMIYLLIIHELSEGFCYRGVKVFRETPFCLLRFCKEIGMMERQHNH